MKIKKIKIADQYGGRVSLWRIQGFTREFIWNRSTISHLRGGSECGTGHCR